MIVQVGKSYLTRDNRKAKVIKRVAANRYSTCEMVCEYEDGTITWRSNKGRFDRCKSVNDFVSEVTN